jgi:hypothetical protein
MRNIAASTIPDLSAGITTILIFLGIAATLAQSRSAAKRFACIADGFWDND